MNYGKQGIKALGLSIIAALGVMALMATAANASGAFTFEEPTKGSIIGKAENTLEGRLLILSLNMEIFCHEATATGSIDETGSGTVTVEITKCLAQEAKSGALSGAVCEIPNITAKATALVILHEGSVKLEVHDSGKGLPFLLLTPEDGLTFAKVSNNSECALPEVANVKGTLIASISNPHGTDVQKLISTKNMSSLFGILLKYGSNSAHLDADMQMELSGTYTGWKWGAV